MILIFQKKLKEFKEKIKNGLNLDEIFYQKLLRLVREASKRTRNESHFDVQLIGGIVLHEGKKLLK